MIKRLFNSIFALSFILAILQLLGLALVVWGIASLDWSHGLKGVIEYIWFGR